MTAAAGPFDGYVLCGGASRRMGRDKALLPLRGRPLAVGVADALAAAGALRVEAVGGDRAGLLAAGLAHRADRWPGEGPLGGMVTALDAPGEAAVAVVLACDLLHPSADAIGALVAELHRSGADGVVPAAAGRPQWLHGAWRRSAGGTLAEAFRSGERSVARAAVRLRLEIVGDLAAEALRDADRPEDLPVPPRIADVDVPAIDIDTLRQRLDEGAPLVDVRQPEEYEEARAPGARLIPLGEVPDRVSEIPTEGTVYVICKSGGRSAKAVEYLRANGVDAVNVAGGTMAWIEAGNAVETGA